MVVHPQVCFIGASSHWESRRRSCSDLPPSAMASQTRANRNPRPPVRLADEQRAESRNEVERRRIRRQARGVNGEQQPAPPLGQADADEANVADDNAERQNREEEEEEQGRDDADEELGNALFRNYRTRRADRLT